MTQDHAVPRARKPFVAQVLVSALLVAPFLVLQLVNRGTTRGDFPVALFLFMSLHALLIVLLVTPALRYLREERRPGALTLGHWAGLSLALLLGYAYATVISDQLPCFLGVPNCD